MYIYIYTLYTYIHIYIYIYEYMNMYACNAQHETRQEFVPQRTLSSFSRADFREWLADKRCREQILLRFPPYMYVYIYIYIHTTHIYIYGIYIYMYVCMYVYIYIYVDMCIIMFISPTQHFCFEQCFVFCGSLLLQRSG